jgi:3',5'-cyclic AMP phosphodiesterase CpdA
MRALKRAIKQIYPRPDFLVVTGDLANRGRTSEMRKARTYLDSVLNELWTEHKHPARCILVPGNHDAWRTTWACPSDYLLRRNRLGKWNAVFPGWSFVAPELPPDKGSEVRPMLLTTYYQELEATTRAHSEKTNDGNPEGEKLGGGRQEERAPVNDLAGSKAIKRANDALQMCEYFPTFGVAFLKLNSNVNDGCWPAQIARGMVGTAQRDRVDEVIHDYEKATGSNGFAVATRVALVHHHLVRLPNAKQEKWMLMDDAGEVTRWLARLNVRFVLHGHFHRADLIQITFWTEPDSSKIDTIVVAGGSATASNPDDKHNSCHYINLGHFQTVLHRPYLDHGEYQPLKEARKFEFAHKPKLTLLDEQGGKVPVMSDALEMSLVEEEKYADSRYYYTMVRSIGLIDSVRAYNGSVELEGINESEYSTNYILFAFTGAGVHYFEDCECRAVDLRTGERLQIELIGDRPFCIFPCRIYFNQPLAPKGTFRIQVEFRVPMVMLNDNDYDVLSLVRFPRGVGRVDMALLSDKFMIGPELWELHGDKFIRSRSNLEEYEIPDNPTGKARRGYKVMIESPAALSYLLFYEKLV